MQVIRAPLFFLPAVLSFCVDAIVALSRIGKFLTAEELEEPYAIDDDMKWAVKAKATFAWETVGKPAASPGGKFGMGDKKEHGGKGKEKKDKKKDAPLLPTNTVDTSSSGENQEKTTDEKPFELRDLELNVPRGSFVAIVGRVGTGKSSLLQGLVGEMRRVSGDVSSQYLAGYMHSFY